MRFTVYIGDEVLPSDTDLAALQVAEVLTTVFDSNHVVVRAELSQEH